jgi:hypothetical protein
MNTKFTRTKAWMKKHQEGLIYTGFIAGVVTLYAGVVVAAVKQANKDQVEYDAAQQKLADAANRGASILPGPDGYFWIIENEKAS